MLRSSPIVLRIGRCSLPEARPLLAAHYAPGFPARVCLTLGAWLPATSNPLHVQETRECRPTRAFTSDPVLAGVLTVSYPTLNDRWRAIAWPGAFDTLDKRRRASLLNAELRRISRVVVDPRFRGMGVASALVRAYLRRPLTSRTEVVAAMGEWCRCFERAGMLPVLCPPPARDVALRIALKRMRVSPESLADDSVVRRLARDARFVQVLRTWANAARATRDHLALRAAPVDIARILAPFAARAAIASQRPARVWVHSLSTGLTDR